MTVRPAVIMLAASLMAWGATAALAQSAPEEPPPPPQAVEEPPPPAPEEQPPQAVEEPPPPTPEEQPPQAVEEPPLPQPEQEPRQKERAQQRERAREAESLLADPSLKPNVRERLERERREAESELSQRGGGEGQPARPGEEQAPPQPPAQAGGEQPPAGPPGNEQAQPQPPARSGGEPSGQPQTAEPQPPVTQPPVTPPTAAVEEARRMTDEELRQRVREGRRQLERGDLSGEASERPEKAREEANAIIRDTRPARDLTADDLRNRVNRNRALLSVEGLTNEERRDLRRRLAEDREALRDRVASERREKRGRDRDRDRPDRPGPPGRFDDWDDPDWERVGDRPGWEDAVRDGRSPRVLSERELNRRIRATRTAIERGYDSVPRGVLVEQLRDDRRELRRRMRDWRDERDDWWDRHDDDVNIAINIMILPDLPPYPRPPIDYAEVDDGMLEEWLIAPPTMPIDRRYTVREIERYPAMRQAMPGIEIDSVRFGFNEDFVPEEEIGELSRIGETLEAILRTNPGEVFLIEGHTDAVGSAAYNMDLSRRRAASVKAALTDFFNIGPGSLETAGYGEQFLKIPTPDEEPENRRVTIRRITPLVGQR